MAIELELSVNDKGSATVDRAANNMSASLRRAESAALGLSSQFSHIGNRILSITGRLFSFNHLIGTLAGGTGVGLLTKKLIELGQAAGDERFNDRVSGLSSAWSGFTGKIGQFISQSPAVQQGLTDLAQKVVDWGNALIANRDVIDQWAGYAAKAVTGVADLITKAIEGMATLAREAPIASMTQAGVTERLRATLSGEVSPLTDSGGLGNVDIGSIIERMQRGETITGSNTTNIVINEKQSRSDVIDIVNESQRYYERNAW